MKKYYILKQLEEGAPIWVAKLNQGDTIYEYNTESQAVSALSSVQSNYPNNLCKVGQL
jgi:hypothetical protein